MPGKTVRSFFYRYKLNHVLFWLSYTSYWIYYAEFFRHYNNMTRSVIMTLVYVFVLAPTAYLVMYFFIPRYYYKRKYFQFLLTFIVLIHVASALIAMGYYLVYFNDPAVIAYLFKPENIYVKSTFSNLVFVGAFVVYRIIRDRFIQAKKDKERNKELEREKLQAELNFLKAQINPHFLFNAINSIYFLIKKDQEAAGETLIKFSDMLRYQLYECNAEKIPLQKECTYLQNYIELERLRNGDNLILDFTLPGNAGNYTIAPFVLIPIVENAFKHVGNDRGEKNKITISVALEDNLLTVYATNTTENVIYPLPENKPAGIGLSNLKRRLELIYAGKHDLLIDTTARLYEITLKIFLDEDPVYNS